MALSFKSISYDENSFIKRLDSKYYCLRKILNNFCENEAVKLEKFDNYIVKITDGEHAGQNFVEKGVLFLKNSSIKDFDISLNDGFYISEEKHKKLNRSALNSKDVLFTTIGHLGSAAIVPENFCQANMNQNFKEGDVLFTKDGKVGEMAIITQTDKAIYQSGVVSIRLNDYGRKLGITQEYIFTALMCKRIGKYNAERYTVTASTIPHLRENHINKILIPIIDLDSIKKITEKISIAFKSIELKKDLILECQQIINKLCDDNLKEV